MKKLFILFNIFMFLICIPVFANDSTVIISDVPTLESLGPYYANYYMLPVESSEVVVAESDFIYYDCIPIDQDLQKYLWDKCKEIGLDYCFALGIIQKESEFNPHAGHSNNDGSYDRGIMQINSCWVKKFKKLGFINSGEDLYDPYKCIDCAMYLLQEYVAKLGNCEQVYAWYNTGNPNIHSNKNSRMVCQYWAEWEYKLYGD